MTASREERDSCLTLAEQIRLTVALHGALTLRLDRKQALALVHLIEIGDRNTELLGQIEAKASAVRDLAEKEGARADFWHRLALGAMAFNALAFTSVAAATIPRDVASLSSAGVAAGLGAVVMLAVIAVLAFRGGDRA